MATATVTLTQRPKAKADTLAPENERFLRCCAEVANALIEDHEAAKDPKNPPAVLNLNTLRNTLSRKHKLKNLPPLTAIMAAVPEHYKKYIMPRLVTKPIRQCRCLPMKH
jgi:elongator complex protein 3